MESTPDCIQTETGLALESNSLHWGHLLWSDPVHKVPGPLSLLRDLGDMIIEELLLSAFVCLVQNDPVGLGVHLQGNTLGMGVVLRPPEFQAHTH